MLIASVSDIHVDFEENREALVKLAVALHRRKPDLAIIAGDVSHRNDRIERALRAFKEVAPQVAYIPGNHDLWYEVPDAPAQSELDTWHRYEVELKALCDSIGVHYLPAEPLFVGKTAVVGSCAWYDYSFVDPQLKDALDRTHLESKGMNGMMWSDVRYIAFRDAHGGLMSDEAVNERMLKTLKTHLGVAEASQDITHTVAVTHHLAFEEAVFRTGTLPWEFFNAFMGSVRTGEVIRQFSKVKTVIYGHTHKVGEHRVGEMRVYGTPLGYPRERVGLTDAQLVDSRIGWIEAP